MLTVCQRTLYLYIVPIFKYIGVSYFQTALPRYYCIDFDAAFCHGCILYRQQLSLKVYKKRFIYQTQKKYTFQFNVYNNYFLQDQEELFKTWVSLGLTLQA